MTVAVAIPCYNVADHIEQVINDIPDSVSWIIAVDDHSTDNTGQLLQRLAPGHPRLIYIRHEKNLGVGGAMITAYQKSMELGVDVTVKLDGDGQMDVSYIPALIKPLKEDKADFTKGNRFRDFVALRSMPLIRRIGNLGLSFLIKAASGYWNIFDPTNGYTAIKNDTLRDINWNKIHKRYFFESSMLIQLYHVNAVVLDVPMKARYGNEKSGLSATRALFEFPAKLFGAFVRRIILRYYLYEFNIASVYMLFGFPLFIGGAVYGLVNFIKYASQQLPAPTGTVVIPALLIIIGFQLLLAALNYDMTNQPRK